mmetsp:Transcript_5929/g.9082  ORF Transcript_5929/g.9082 Transcript_5929/m.9082 type:complete len:325 (+) Transcript_5929:121-1095(+)|eukprot:CAMPEP_0178920576 /NCGR_PEP_ID=MMETSP0786-20121207/15081_1 /TAXON_ID=186022 /ORGANISM="Thalassionema frauenfeldii, Strain CCMP 1798" /LENGTH=324 /DNA_ID=CAMNT_0020594657 /DNA_START=57 /DNA_END=1034 /DNA_ORIENTATION=+
MALESRTINTINDRLPCGRRAYILISVLVVVFIVLVATLSGINTKDANALASNVGDSLLGEPICNSLYKVGGNNEHSPVIFEDEQLMVCRTPQAGTKFLRDLTVSYVESNLESFPPEEMKTGFQHINPTLDKVVSMDEFHQYLFGDETHRVMVVRHPVTRIVSGFYEIASAQPDKFWKTIYGFKKNHGSNPKAFAYWLKHSRFAKEDYQADCTNFFFNSLHAQIQHWAPPQHCRCGLDCGVDWTYYKIEDMPIYAVMASYLPSLQNVIVKKQLAKDNIMETYTEDQFDVDLYLTNSVLDMLNKLTKEEQEFFDYEPYKRKNYLS